MSLFQCEHCGCVENTACASQGFVGIFAEPFDWIGLEDRKGKRLCSACGPSHYRDGKPTEFGKWHGEFERMYLPMGEFKTNAKGNLEHIASGDEDFQRFAIRVDEA